MPQTWLTVQESVNLYMKRLQLHEVTCSFGAIRKTGNTDQQDLMLLSTVASFGRKRVSVQTQETTNPDLTSLALFLILNYALASQWINENLSAEEC